MPRLIAILLFLVPGIVLAAVAWPLQQRRIAPNTMYGLRTPHTLADPALWYLANEVAGRTLLAFALSLVAAAIVVPFVVPVVQAVLVLLAFTSVGALTVYVRVSRSLRQLIVAHDTTPRAAG